MIYSRVTSAFPNSNTYPSKCYLVPSIPPSGYLCSLCFHGQLARPLRVGTCIVFLLPSVALHRALVMCVSSECLLNEKPNTKIRRGALLSSNYHKRQRETFLLLKSFAVFPETCHYCLQKRSNSQLHVATPLSYHRGVSACAFSFHGLYIFVYTLGKKMYIYVYTHNFILFIYLLGVDMASKHGPPAVICSNIERIY